MFDGARDGSSVIDADTVRAFTEALATGRGPSDDAGRIDLIRAIEEMKCAGEGRQAFEAVELDVSQRAEQAAAGVRPERQGRGVAAQVGLARRVSTHRGQRLLALAKVLPEMPHTMAAFRAGRISEWRVTILMRETAMLEREERAVVDEQLASDVGRLEGMGDKQLQGAAASLAARLDPASVARRRRKAEEERSVTIRPAPDTMTYVTALLPVAQGVAVHAALTRDAASLRATGDPRTQGQVMADTLVERVTGQGTATAVPTAVTVVLSDGALLAGADDDALIAPGASGGGAIPAELARELVLASLDETTRTGLRRLYQAPDGRLVAMESSSRCFPAQLAGLVRIRDEVCRTPWCDAPIRQIDHVVAHDDGGETDFENAQGLCEACNHAKQAPGWRARPGPGGVVDTTTPTGHRYRSLVPSRPPPEVSRMEIWFRDRLALHYVPECA